MKLYLFEPPVVLAGSTMTLISNRNDTSLIQSPYTSGKEIDSITRGGSLGLRFSLIDTYVPLSFSVHRPNGIQ